MVGIEWWLIKFDLCVYFDCSSLLTTEAPGPWGTQYVNRPILVEDSPFSTSVCVCVCVCEFVFVKFISCQLLLPWRFSIKGPNCERARGDFRKLEEAVTVGKEGGKESHTDVNTALTPS